MGTNEKYQSVSWTLPIPPRFIGPSIKHQNWELCPQYYVVFDDMLYTVEHMSKVAVPVNWKNLVEEHIELATQENFTHEK